MQYPINLRFKVVALASQIFVTDSNGAGLFYVKQKLFKLRENIEIYRDDTKTELLYTIRTDKIIDFSATYTLYDAQGKALGSIKRKGARSILKASYDLELGGQPFAHIREANPWVKLGDALFSELPLIGIVAGYVFHPKYIVENSVSEQIALLKKIPAFFEGKFMIEGSGIEKSDEKSQQYTAALLMMVILLERSRG